MNLHRNDIFESMITIVSENQTLANILKEQCTLYGFNNVHIAPTWNNLIHSLVQAIPDVIVADQLPASTTIKIREILQSRTMLYDSLPVILYSLKYDPSKVKIPDGLTIVASLYGRDQQQRLLEVIHRELDKAFLDADKLFEARKSRQHLNILLATSEQELHSNIQAALKKEGFYVSVVENGKDVITHIQGILPHIVFLDYTLPGMNGLSLFYWLKTVYPETVVILMMSESDDPELLLELEKSGVHNYLKKPFETSVVLALCWKVFEKTKQEEHLEENAKVSEELILLKESEEKFRTLVNASGDIIFRITPQGILNFASPAVEEQLGYTREDLEEERINVGKFVHAHDLIRVMAGIRQVIQGHSIQGLECRLMHQDKVQFRWYSINCYPIYNSQKKFAGVGGIARDIGSIKRFEEQIRKQNERLSTLNTIASIVSQSLNPEEILGNVLDKVLEFTRLQAGSFFLVDSETKTFTLKSCRSYSPETGGTESDTFNACEICDKLQKEVLKTAIPLVIEDLSEHPQLSETRLAETGFRTLISIPLKSKEVILGMMILVTKEQRDISEDDLQLLLSIGNEVGMTIENINLYQQEHKARERLEELNKLKDDFVAIVSHDLRSPLTAILGTSELLLNDKYMDPPLTGLPRELVENIHEMGNHQLHLVNDLLDLAKIESGKLELRPVMSDLEMLGRYCYETLKVLAHNKNIEMNFITEPDLPRISIDEPKIGQVINNLVSNAIKFTEPGGKVTLSIEREEDNFLRVSVSDTGIGIEPEDLLNLFDKFQQARSLGTGGERGTGLGLSICKNLIELHNGKIWAESRAGIGSTFSFSLPITENVILIIDDSQFVIKSLESMLIKHIDYIKVVHAMSGAEGLQCLEEIWPVVIILDYMMPEMDGIAVYQELRNRYGAKVPPTIFLTASQDLEVRRRIFELGASDYLQKPVDINDLLPRLSRLL